MSADASDLLARLSDVVPVAVVVAAGDGRVLRLNDAARRMLGFKPGEGEGSLRLADLHHRPEDVRTQREALARRVTEGAAQADPMELSLRARDGAIIPVRARVAVVRSPDGRAVGTVHSYEDLRELRSLTQRLEDAVGQVSSLEQRVSGQAVLARAAHELSQPLTAALGQIDLLLIEEAVTDAAGERLERAAEQLERMRNLVHDLTRAANAQRARS